MVTVNCHKPLALVTMVVLPATGAQLVIGVAASGLANTEYCACGVPTNVSVNVPSGLSATLNNALVWLQVTESFTT